MKIRIQGDILNEIDFEKRVAEATRKVMLDAMLGGKSVLVTGGTGSWGKVFVRTILNYPVGRVLVFSRDEQKHELMRSEIKDDRLRFLIGTVRELPRLRRACAGVDYLIHAAAMKIVPLGEYNPGELRRTNIEGSANVAEAALDLGVKKAVFLSSDKACEPINAYGKSKAFAESEWIQANSYVGKADTKYSCVRYGNVAGSKGSVVPVWKRQRESGEITITDPSMTRFWMKMSEAVDLVLTTLLKMQGGEIFIPQLPSMRLGDLAKALAPDCKHTRIDPRGGEKPHETLVSKYESSHTVKSGEVFVVLPEHQFWQAGYEGEPLPEGFSYSSDTNERFLTVEELRGMV